MRTASAEGPWIATSCVSNEWSSSVTFPEMFDRIQKRGYLYAGTYKGLYCAECENYVIDARDTEGRCPDHGIPLDEVEEDGLFFRLSAYGPKLLEHYDRHPEFVEPETRMNEVRRFVSEGLQDLC